MKLDILDVDKFVEVNTLELVNDPIFFTAGNEPADGGLFSLRIFGRPGSPERSKKWGYIDLRQPFLHPAVYKALTQLFRKIDRVLSNDLHFILDAKNNLLIIDEPNAKSFTGLDDLYKKWGEINWGNADNGTQRDDKIKFLKSIPKKLAFVDKWHVMPAMFRDVNFSTGGHITDVPPINNLYSKLITMAPPTPSGLQLLDGSRRLRAQQILLDIHTSQLDMIKGKKGAIQETVLGKEGDYGVRPVISGPELGNAETVDDQEVKYGELGIPLYLLVNMYQPFVLGKLNEIFKGIAERQENLFSIDSEGNESIIEIPDEVRIQLTSDTYKKWVSRYMRSQESRLEPLTFDLGPKKKFTIPLHDAILGRATTLTDLFFIIVSDLIYRLDLHAFFTRYPVTDYQACHFVKPVILTTEKTTILKMNDEKIYKNYPVLNSESRLRWIDSVRLHNSYTTAIGGDYDGFDSPIAANEFFF